MFTYSPNICNQLPLMYYFFIPNPLLTTYFSTQCQLKTLAQHQNTTTHPTHMKQEELDYTTCLHPAYCQKAHNRQNKPQIEQKAQLEAQIFESQLKNVKSRNILPNAINLILSFIRRVNKSGRLVEKIVNKLGEGSYSLKKYYSYQSYLKDAITNYTSKNILQLATSFCEPSCAIFSLNQQKFYNMVTTKLVLHFIKEEGLLALFTSKKEHKTLKTDHLKVYRFIINDLRRQSKKQLELK